MALAAARARRAVTHAVAAAVAALMREWIMLVRARRSPAVFAAIPQAAHALTRIVIADAMTCTAARASARNLLAAFASEAASASAGACAVGTVRTPRPLQSYASPQRYGGGGGEGGGGGGGAVTY